MADSVSEDFQVRGEWRKSGRIQMGQWQACTGQLAEGWERLRCRWMSVGVQEKSRGEKFASSGCFVLLI